ncbi:MAG TPA: radical SAM protein [Candidatus Bathyarchaeia archaeon]|nr:radical SAM protein [Candidatus Bathyarchaeia archaeon]
MTTVTLVYPFFRPSPDKSIFRFPPLGPAYIVSYLRHHGVSASLVDCTFLTENEAVDRVRNSEPKIVGIYSMFSMKTPALRMARLLRDHCQMLVAGGPLPTLRPEDFMEEFDIAGVGEGEKTMLELAEAVEGGRSLSTIKGIVYKKERASESSIVHMSARAFIQHLDGLPFPARDQFDNDAYMKHYKEKFGYTVTSVITSRGCPFQCDFCSRAVFGHKFRTRSAANVVNEMEDVKSLGYERIWFSDDCFTLNKKRLLSICDELIRRRLDIEWECLSRVDTIDMETAQKMKRAGCVRVFFGLESGNDAVLKLMHKRASVKEAKRAVLTSKTAGIKVGAFFIVGYPGETDETILDTLRFASSLPLDYLSFSVPYPIPGTSLYDRVKDSIEFEDLNQPKHLSVTDHKLIYRSSFSEAKLKLAIVKGSAQFKLRKKLGDRGYRFLGAPLEHLTDYAFRLLR